MFKDRLAIVLKTRHPSEPTCSALLETTVANT